MGKEKGCVHTQCGSEIKIYLSVPKKMERHASTRTWKEKDRINLAHSNHTQNASRVPAIDFFYASVASMIRWDKSTLVSLRNNLAKDFGTEGQYREASSMIILLCNSETTQQKYFLFQKSMFKLNIFFFKTSRFLPL